ncbi:hypothetical protein [Streptomyces rubellomurinus]|uniref:Uncharacterized protein n=1 Tax=Streptomyces rubellomurinus (strain ATCC 31215) TaxID=359131 RepID=A0A0F2TEL7_STRR3|nr:hypothetical protein [Streptomyces rubellomurinus]KJS60941.1 hypothetical protein VM95_18205 [Streptomyces rubellomurinus]
MPGTDRLHTLTWQYVTGLVPSEEPPMAAAGLLAAGLDSPALRRLAGRLVAGELTPRALAAEGWRGATPTAARADAERGLLDAVDAGYRLAHLTETRP